MEFCPKCGSERRPKDSECPRCGVIYEKYQAIVDKKREERERKQKIDTAPKWFDLRKNTIENNEGPWISLLRKKQKGVIAISIAVLGIIFLSTISPLDLEVSGEAWIVMGGGQSYIIRGLPVYVLRNRIRKIEVDDVLSEIKSRVSLIESEYQTEADGNNKLERCREFRKIMNLFLFAYRGAEDYSLSGIHTLIRSYNTLDDSTLYSSYRKDRLWPKVFKRCIVSTTTTDINGKYSIKDIEPGDCLLYSIYVTNFSLVEWLIPINGNKTNSISLNLYNGTALRIVND